MAGIIRFNRRELNSLIESIETSGGDATPLRNLLDNSDQDELELKGFEFSPEGYIETKRGQSKVARGENLACCICKRQVDILLDGVCEVCFRDWALSTVKQERAGLPRR